MTSTYKVRLHTVREVDQASRLVENSEGIKYMWSQILHRHCLLSRMLTAQQQHKQACDDYLPKGCKDSPAGGCTKTMRKKWLPDQIRGRSPTELLKPTAQWKLQISDYPHNPCWFLLLPHFIPERTLQSFDSIQHHSICWQQISGSSISFDAAI